MGSILGWLVKIFNLLQHISQQTDQILTGQQQLQIEIVEIQSDLAIIKKVVGIGVPVSETIEWGQPK